MTCPRCAGQGTLTEWCIERKVAMLAFLWIKRELLCHVCRGGGQTSEHTAKKWLRVHA